MTTSVASPDKNRVSFAGWLPAQEAADHLGVSREYIYRLKAIYDEGGAGVPGFMLGDKSHVLMFRVTDLDAYARSHPDLGKGRSKTDETVQEADTQPANA
jgi:hypothetical protein